jgi:hypothetical protein
MVQQAHHINPTQNGDLSQLILPPAGRTTLSNDIPITPTTRMTRAESADAQVEPTINASDIGTSSATNLNPQNITIAVDNQPATLLPTVASSSGSTSSYGGFGGRFYHVAELVSVPSILNSLQEQVLKDRPEATYQDTAANFLRSAIDLNDKDPATFTPEYLTKVWSNLSRDLPFTTSIPEIKTVSELTETTQRLVNSGLLPYETATKLHEHINMRQEKALSSDAKSDILNSGLRILVAYANTPQTHNNSTYVLGNMTISERLDTTGINEGRCNTRRILVEQALKSDMEPLETSFLLHHGEKYENANSESRKLENQLRSRISTYNELKQDSKTVLTDNNVTENVISAFTMTDEQRGSLHDRHAYNNIVDFVRTKARATSTK